MHLYTRVDSTLRMYRECLPHLRQHRKRIVTHLQQAFRLRKRASFRDRVALLLLHHSHALSDILLVARLRARWHFLSNMACMSLWFCSKPSTDLLGWRFSKTKAQILNDILCSQKAFERVSRRTKRAKLLTRSAATAASFNWSSCSQRIRARMTVPRHTLPEQMASSRRSVPLL